MVERLQVCRKRSGLSLRKLEVLINKCHSTIGEVHTGRANATEEMLALLAGVYRTTVTWLRDGNPRVDIWSEFIQSEGYRLVGGLTATGTERTAAILHFLAARYPGHMLVEDIAKHFHVSVDLVTRIYNQETEPKKAFLMSLSDLAGVPEGWLQVGDHHFMANEFPVEQWTPEEIRQVIQLGQMAKQAGVPFDHLVAFVKSYKK